MAGVQSFFWYSAKRLFYIINGVGNTWCLSSLFGLCECLFAVLVQQQTMLDIPEEYGISLPRESFACIMQGRRMPMGLLLILKTVLKQYCIDVVGQIGEVCLLTVGLLSVRVVVWWQLPWVAHHPHTPCCFCHACTLTSTPSPAHTYTHTYPYTHDTTYVYIPCYTCIHNLHITHPCTVHTYT